MGFFDKFGAGGGKVSVDVQSPQVAAGGVMRGTITFTGGKRSQKVTSLVVWLTKGAGTEINLAKGKIEEDDGGDSAPLGKKVVVTGELAVEAGQTCGPFAFELPIPTAVMNSRSMDINGQPGPIMQLYRVWGSADIPGEIDKHGQSGNFEVTGGLKLEVTVGSPS
jgi:hypothetical protein